jgi:hypothetical protein
MLEPRKVWLYTSVVTARPLAGIARSHGRPAIDLLSFDEAKKHEGMKPETTT